MVIFFINFEDEGMDYFINNFVLIYYCFFFIYILVIKDMELFWLENFDMY